MNNYFCLNYVVTKGHPSGITIQAQGSCGLNISNDIKQKVDLFMDHNINRLLRIQQGKSKKNSWEEVEKKIGITFPEDYKLFWNFKDNTLEIVVYESRYARNISYKMGMEEFLCKLLKKEIECPIFPDDFILESNYYETTYSIEGRCLR